MRKMSNKKWGPFFSPQYIPLLYLYLFTGISATDCKVCEHVAFMAANSDVSATAHQIVELCEWRGERAYRPNQANGLRKTSIP